MPRWGAPTTAEEMDGVGAASVQEVQQAVRQQVVSKTNSAANAIQQMSNIAEANSAASAEQARITREWQEKQNAKAMEFSASEAAKNRDWQKMMSDTAHQREIADLKAAGLNPVLSAMGGNGASVGSGATAAGVTSSGATGQVDMSMNNALVNLLGSIYNRTTQIEAANINARTQEAVADKYTAMSEIVALISADASKYGSNLSYAASKYGADSSRAASKYGADASQLASFFSSFASAITGKYSADSAKDASKYAADKNQETQYNKVGGSYDFFRWLFDSDVNW